MITRVCLCIVSALACCIIVVSPFLLLEDERKRKKANKGDGSTDPEGLAELFASDADADEAPGDDEAAVTDEGGSDHGAGEAGSDEEADGSSVGKGSGSGSDGGEESGGERKVEVSKKKRRCRCEVCLVYSCPDIGHYNVCCAPLFGGHWLLWVSSNI